MTAILYPDIAATARSGRFTLEACSPHNGTIPHRNGQPATDAEYAFKYRDHQSEFRYRCRDNQTDRIVWERWQPQGEDSPRQLLVADAGWSIVQTHGFHPEVIAFEPGGAESIRVEIVDKDAEHSPSGIFWQPDNLMCSTAGSFWTGDSWPYFLDHQNRPWFCWRTAWGQRLVFDLSRSRVLTDADQTADLDLTRALDAAEQDGARDLLAAFALRMNEVCRFLRPGADRVASPAVQMQLDRVRAAIHLVGVHRLRDGLAWLREWEAIDCGSWTTSSTAMGRGDVASQYFRPILHHSIRLLDAEPVGYPAYHFLDAQRNRLPSAERLTDRRARLAQLDPELDAGAVLALLGAPDFVQRQSHPVGKKMYRWTERWEYDFRLASGWVTTRITWEEQKKTGRITTIDEVPAEWRHNDDRIRAIFEI